MLRLPLPARSGKSADVATPVTPESQDGSRLLASVSGSGQTVIVSWFTLRESICISASNLSASSRSRPLAGAARVVDVAHQDERRRPPAADTRIGRDRRRPILPVVVHIGDVVARSGLAHHAPPALGTH